MKSTAKGLVVVILVLVVLGFMAGLLFMGRQSLDQINREKTLMAKNKKSTIPLSNL